MSQYTNIRYSDKLLRTVRNEVNFMDDSALDLELEQQLEQEDELLLLLSTPRQRLEDARAMADGVASTDTEKIQGSFEGTGERETHYCMADSDLSSQSEGVYGEEQEAKHLLQVNERKTRRFVNCLLATKYMIYE